MIICFFLPAALEGYATPQAVRYMFPFAPFEWVLFALCAVTFCQYYFKRLSSNDHNRSKKIAVVAGIILFLVLIYFDVQDIITRNQLPLSAARPFSQDLCAGKYKNTAFVFIPDVTACVIDYYVRHDKRVKDADALLSTVHGCARWNDKTPVVPGQYEALFNDPNLLKTVEENISNLPLDKYQTIVLVCASGPINDACGRVSADLRQWLDKTYKLKSMRGYLGRLEGYIMLVYDRS